MEKTDKPMAAVQWTGAESDVEAARAALSPRFHIFRMRERLRGEVLKVTAGAKTLTVPRGCWLITSPIDESVRVVDDKDFRAMFQQPAPAAS